MHNKASYEYVLESAADAKSYMRDEGLNPKSNPGGEAQAKTHKFEDGDMAEDKSGGAKGTPGAEGKAAAKWEEDDTVWSKEEYYN